MAVGLAATTALVAVAHAILLRPLLYPKPERWFRLNTSTSDRDVMDNGLGADLGPPLYVPYLQQNTATARVCLTIRTPSMAAPSVVAAFSRWVESRERTVNSHVLISARWLVASGSLTATRIQP